MEAEDKARFGKAIGAMLEAFGQEGTQARLYGYWIGLMEYHIGDVENAVASVLKACVDRWPPPPAKLGEIIRGGSEEQRAIQAWADVQRAMPQGRYRHVDFRDVVINAAIRSLGGWPALFDRCNSAEGEKWYRIEFMKAYAAHTNGGPSAEAYAPLPGMSEAEVVEGRVSRPRPRRIGCDDSRARLCEHVRPRIEQRKPVKPLVALKGPSDA